MDIINQLGDTLRTIGLFLGFLFGCAYVHHNNKGNGLFKILFMIISGLFFGVLGMVIAPLGVMLAASTYFYILIFSALGYFCLYTFQCLNKK